MRMLLVTFAVLASPASAAIVTLDFTGTVATFSDEGVLDSSISVGTPFQLHVRYDESAPPSEVTPNDSRWIFGVPPAQITLTVGSYSTVAGPLGGDPTQPDGFQLILADSLAGSGNSDYFQLGSSASVSGGSVPLSGSVGVLLADSTGTALASPLQLGAVPFDLASWDPYSDNGSWSIVQLVLKDPNDPSGAEAAVNGRIENIAVSRVPEPWAGPLAAALVVALAAVRSRF